MATDIPGPQSMMVQLLVNLALQGVSAIFAAFHKGGAAAAVDTTNQVAMALLKKTAEVQGLTIDWTDPAAVAGYVSTLPTFTPIPEPGTTPITQGTKGPTSAPGPAANPAPGTQS